MVYDSAIVKYWFLYSHHVAEHFDTPLAEIVTTSVRDYNSVAPLFPHQIMGCLRNSYKAWRQINNEPIQVFKCRDGNMKYDQDEFLQMLFVAEEVFL